MLVPRNPSCVTRAFVVFSTRGPMENEPMKMSRLCLVVSMSIFASLASIAGCAEPPPPKEPDQPAATAEAPTPPTTATAETVAPPPTAAPVAEPPPKPAKEKIAGKWQFSFEGDPKSKVEEEAKKKFPKDKDQAKRDAMIKKVADEAAGEWIEFADGHYVSHTTVKGKDKVVLKIKYDVSKDESSKLVMKPVGKDEVSKKELKDEVSVTFVDDNTITMVDPKKNMTLTFKRK